MRPFCCSMHVHPAFSVCSLLALLRTHPTPQALQESLPTADSSQGSSPLGLGWLSALEASSASLIKTAGSLFQHQPETSQFQPPPRVQAWVGDQPRSFPLRLQHAGRCVLDMLLDNDQMQRHVCRPDKCLTVCPQATPALMVPMFLAFPCKVA